MEVIEQRGMVMSPHFWGLLPLVLLAVMVMAVLDFAIIQPTETHFAG